LPSEQHQILISVWRTHSAYHSACLQSFIPTFLTKFFNWLSIIRRFNSAYPDLTVGHRHLTAGPPLVRHLPFAVSTYNCFIMLSFLRGDSLSLRIAGSIAPRLQVMIRNICRGPRPHPSSAVQRVSFWNDFPSAPCCTEQHDLLPLPFSSGTSDRSGMNEYVEVRAFGEASIPHQAASGS
jgi:hypothetical protein